MARRAPIRGIALVLVLGLLVALFVLGGANWPAEPVDDIGPDGETLEADYDAYVGEAILTGGTAVGDDRVHLEPEDTELVVTLERTDGEPPDLEPGADVTLYGEIGPDETIVVDPDHLATRMPWEVYYMYAISLLGAVITTVFALNYWRFDRRAFVLEPREEPVVPLLGLTEDDRHG